MVVSRRTADEIRKTHSDMAEVISRWAELLRRGNRPMLRWLRERWEIEVTPVLKLIAYLEVARAEAEGREPDLRDIYYIRDTVEKRGGFLGALKRRLGVR